MTHEDEKSAPASLPTPPSETDASATAPASPTAGTAENQTPAAIGAATPDAGVAQNAPVSQVAPGNAAGSAGVKSDVVPVTVVPAEDTPPMAPPYLFPGHRTVAADQSAAEDLARRATPVLVEVSTASRSEYARLAEVVPDPMLDLYRTARAAGVLLIHARSDVVLQCVPYWISRSFPREGEGLYRVLEHRSETMRTGADRGGDELWALLSELCRPHRQRHYAITWVRDDELLRLLANWFVGDIEQQSQMVATRRQLMDNDAGLIVCVGSTLEARPRMDSCKRHAIVIDWLQWRLETAMRRETSRSDKHARRTPEELVRAFHDRPKAAQGGDVAAQQHLVERALAEGGYDGFLERLDVLLEQSEGAGPAEVSNLDVMHKAALVVASHVRGLSLREFSVVMEQVLDGQCLVREERTVVTNADGTKEKRKRRIELDARAEWQRDPDGVLRACGLCVLPNEERRPVVGFHLPSAGARLRERLQQEEAFLCDELTRRLYVSGLMYWRDTPDHVANHVMAMVVTRLAAESREEGVHLLLASLRQIDGPRHAVAVRPPGEGGDAPGELLVMFEHRSREEVDFLKSRLARLCAKLLTDSRTAGVVDGVLDRLLSQGRDPQVEGVVVDLVMRLRRADGFDLMKWVEQLWARGGAGARASVMVQLLRRSCHEPELRQRMYAWVASRDAAVAADKRPAELPPVDNYRVAFPVELFAAWLEASAQDRRVPAGEGTGATSKRELVPPFDSSAPAGLAHANPVDTFAAWLTDPRLPRAWEFVFRDRVRAAAVAAGQSPSSAEDEARRSLMLWAGTTLAPSVGTRERDRERRRDHEDALVHRAVHASLLCGVLVGAAEVAGRCRDEGHSPQTLEVLVRLRHAVVASVTQGVLGAMNRQLSRLLRELAGQTRHLGRPGREEARAVARRARELLYELRALGAAPEKVQR